MVHHNGVVGLLAVVAQDLGLGPDLVAAVCNALHGAARGQQQHEHTQFHGLLRSFCMAIDMTAL
jgi:hypothetical protein